MKITIITSNQKRHNYLINELSKTFTKIYVIQEKKSNNFSVEKHLFNSNKLFTQYNEKVSEAENKILKFTKFENSKNIKLLKLNFNEINTYDFSKIEEFFKSNIYIVYGCSFLKGEIANSLIKNNAINIHMGISPFYRGASCNFWALYDNNPHLVGATIHKLSFGLDNGPIIYHAVSNKKTTIYEYTMYAVKSAFHSIIDKIQNNELFNIVPKEQIKTNLIRFSRKSDLNEITLQNFFNKTIDINKKKFDKKILINPFFLD